MKHPVKAPPKTAGAMRALKVNLQFGPTPTPPGSMLKKPKVAK